MKKISFLILIIFLMQSVLYSQDILHKLEKVNLKLIEHSAIKRTKKKMDISKEKQLSTYPYFTVFFNTKIEYEHCSVADLFGNMRVSYNNTESFVFDDSLSVLATVTKKHVYVNHNRELIKEYMYIRYFHKLKPEFIFRVFNTPMQNYLFLCYKNNDIYIVYMSNNEDRIISYPLSEFDCRLLYFDDFFQIKEENLPQFPQK